MTTALTILDFLTAFVLIATERIHRVAAALGGVAVMVLLGMMITVSVLKHTGVFDYLAIWSAKKSCGRTFRLMVILVLFVMVGGLVDVGAIDTLGRAAIDLAGDDYLLAAVGLIIGSAVVGGMIDTSRSWRPRCPSSRNSWPPCPIRTSAGRCGVRLRSGPTSAATPSRRERQRRRHRLGGPQRPSHRLLGVHQARPRGHRGDHRPGHPLRLAAVLRAVGGLPVPTGGTGAAARARGCSGRRLAGCAHDEGPPGERRAFIGTR
ncbi:SLC13 family permease [Saccharopolyspora sp. NPDC050642]|uniref:SLC13 family permease n=1 Tax=Saccharopolyspora sp. NPDC050642 TaxID=3157099 RepID=UPI00340BEB05